MSVLLSRHYYGLTSPQDSCKNLLAVLVAPSTMTVWNTDTGTKVSRFTFTESIHAFLFNPFKPDDLVCEFKGLYQRIPHVRLPSSLYSNPPHTHTHTHTVQSTDCLIFINNFNPGRNPTGGGKKFYLTASDTATPLSGRGKPPLHLQRRLVAGDQLRYSVEGLSPTCTFIILPRYKNSYLCL